MNSFYLDAIKKFEGFTQRAEWDYAQHTNGYGTRALFPGENIDRAEAERRFQTEIGEARAIVERNAPHADEGTKAALTSLTFNAGDKWTRSGLGEALRQGDTETARELFLQYNKAGGQTLPGLVARRVAEAEWIGNLQGPSAAKSPVEVRTAVMDGSPAGAAGVDMGKLLPDSESAAPRQGESGPDRTFTSLALAAADRFVGGMSIAALEAPEQRFGQQASTLLMLLQLEKVPVLTNRSQASDDGDRSEHRRPLRNGGFVRT
ncbi:MAG: lysozyme [Hyphomicrobiaceae bacterium]